jgi:hypothetical protein
MRRRVGSTAFKSLYAASYATKAVDVVEMQQVQNLQSKIVAAPNLVRGQGCDDEGWIVYDPIDDVPDLFLRFARLYGESDFNRAALDFTNKYGLPNGADEAPAPVGEPGFQAEAMNWSLSQFHHEARRAWVVLALYEAVLNDEYQTVGRLLSKHSDIETFGSWLNWLQGDPAEHQNYALTVGLRCAQEAAEKVVHKYCRQEILAVLDPNVRLSVSH